MKRQREVTEEDGDDGKKKCVTRWSRRSSHNEQRSGVVTVGASSFKPMATTSSVTTPPSPPPPSPPPPPHLHAASPSSYLLQLRNLADEALISNSTVSSLVDHVSKKFLLAPRPGSWGEECESVLTVLYFGLHYPIEVSPLFVKEIALDFIRRWINDNEKPDLSCISALFTDSVKSSDFCTLLLLLGNHFPQEVNSTCLEECLGWDRHWTTGISAPEWLLNVSGCLESEETSLRYLLNASVMMLKGIPLKVRSQDYVGVMTDFLLACNMYKQAQYGEALTCLQSINSDKCCNDLQGWILWLMGLGLLKLAKPKTALLKLQAAVDKCDSCFPAVFNVSQIFYSKGINTAEMETLSLLSVGGKDWQPYAKMNLQAALLRVHHPPPDDLFYRALYVLAARRLYLKMYAEACEDFTSLLENLQDSVLNPATNCRTLFRPEDDIATLPSFESIIVLQALAYFQKEDFESTLTVLSHIDKKDYRFCSYYEDPEDKKIECIVIATACLIKTSALSKLDKTVEALRECVILEQDLSWVKGALNSAWEIYILMLKTLLYSTLSSFHGLKKNLKSHSHYERLASQNSRLLTQSSSVLQNEDLTLSSRLIIDNIYSFINEQLGTIM